MVLAGENKKTRLFCHSNTFLPFYLPTFLPSYLPTFLPSYLPTFLPSYLGFMLVVIQYLDPVGHAVWTFIIKKLADRQTKYIYIIV